MMIGPLEVISLDSRCETCGCRADNGQCIT